MKNAAGLLVVLFLIILLSPFLFAYLFPEIADPGNENRTLAIFPNIQDTEIFGWTGEFDKYLNDHVPFKNQASKLYSELLMKVFNESSSEHVVVGKNGWLLYNGYNNDNPIADLTGISTFSEEDELTILSKINLFRDSHPDIPFVLLIAPNKESVYTDAFPNSYRSYFSEETRSEHLSHFLRNKTDSFCFPLDELVSMKDNYQLYYRYDTHWNQIGAYLGWSSACQQLAVRLPELSDEMIAIEDAIPIRDLAGISNTKDIHNDDIKYKVIPYKNNTVNIDKSKPLFEKSYAYIKRSVSNAPNTQTVILVGDSFAEVMFDLAAETFQKVIFIRRDLEHNDEINSLVKKLIAEENNCLVVMEMVERGAGHLKSQTTDYVF